MSKTVVANMQIPASFANYVAEEATLKTPLFASGVIANVPGLAIVKGATISMPSLAPLAGDDEVLADNASLTVGNVASKAEKAIVNTRGRAFSVNDLAAGYSGADLVGFVGDKIVDYRAGRLQAHGLSVLVGSFASTGMADHVLSTTAAYDAEAMIDAEFKMGDAREKLALVLAHSATVAIMEKANQIASVAGADGRPLKTYRGRTVIEFDSVPLNTIYLVGQGALGYAEGIDLASFETARDILAADTIIASRWSYVLHPRGLSTTLDLGANGKTPTNTAYEAGSAWARVGELKNIPMVAYKFNQV